MMPYSNNLKSIDEFNQFLYTLIQLSGILQMSPWTKHFFLCPQFT